MFNEKPVAIINFKSYKESTGKNAVMLAKICEKVAKEMGREVWVAVNPVDLKDVASEVSIPVLCQTAAPVGYGAYTGWIPPELIKDLGGKGTLLNHSEHQLSDDKIEGALKLCKKNGLTVVICADTPKRSEEVARFKPDFIAIEPPELIGGDISVSTAKPEIVTEAVSRVRKVAKIPVLCGAGIKNGNDVKKSIELGVKGILVASGITKASNPEAALRDLLAGFD